MAPVAALGSFRRNRRAPRSGDQSGLVSALPSSPEVNRTACAPGAMDGNIQRVLWLSSLAFCPKIRALSPTHVGELSGSGVPLACKLRYNSPSFVKTYTALISLPSLSVHSKATNFPVWLHAGRV